MRHVANNKRLVVGLLGFGLIALASTAFAVETNPDATLQVNDSLSIAEVAPLNFGTFNKPSTGSATFTLDPVGGSNAVTEAGGTDAFHADDAIVGEYTLSGSGDQSVNVDVSVVDDGTDFVTFDSIYVNGPASTTTGASLTTGSLTLYIGGQVTITQDAVPGTFTQTYNITANYE